MPSARSPDPQAVLAYLSRYTHRVAISNSRLVAMDERGVTLPLEGLPRQGQDALQDDDAQRRRVHAPLPAARSARRLPPHPPLRAARQCRPQGNLARARELLHVVPEAAEPQPPDEPTATVQPIFVCRTVVRRCSSSRPSHAGNRFVPHRHSEPQHDQYACCSHGASALHRTSGDSATALPCAARACLSAFGAMHQQESAIAAPPLTHPSRHPSVPDVARLPPTARLPTIKSP